MTVDFDAVLLASFGGPEGPDEVMPFLERVTAGRGVPRDRLEQVAEHYYALGGVSPINAQNRALLDALRARMDARGLDLPVYWGNRNSAPFFADALREAADDGHRRVLALTTSAYSSYSGCRQYRENLAGALAEAGLVTDVEVRTAGQYWDRDGFVAPFADAVAEQLAGARRDGLRDAEVVVLFTTHSIPESMDRTAGPDEDRAETGPGLYERQHLQVAERVMRDEPVRWRLVFQSRSGPPQVPWLGPDVNDAVREEAAAGCRRVIVVPIGFISDHVEVIWDLDHEARATADEVGVDLVRIPTPGTDPRFVDALVDVITSAFDAPVAGVGGTCSATCCLNPRTALPVVPRVGRPE